MKTVSRCWGMPTQLDLQTLRAPRSLSHLISPPPSSRVIFLISGTYGWQKASCPLCSVIPREVISDAFCTIRQLAWGQPGFLNRTWQSQWKQFLLASGACKVALEPQDSASLDWGMNLGIAHPWLEGLLMPSPP